MERKERRHHTREFKLEAVRLAAAGDKTKAKVARELGVRVNQLRQWRLDLEEEERNGVPKQELATAEQDLGRLCSSSCANRWSGSEVYAAFRSCSLRCLPQHVHVEVAVVLEPGLVRLDAQGADQAQAAGGVREDAHDPRPPA